MTGAPGERTGVLPGIEDTIAAVATATGRGALAIVRLSGTGVSHIAPRILDTWPLQPREATLVLVSHPDTGEMIDRAVATYYRAPASYTGEDALELSVHGGEAVPVLTLDAMIAAGAREALPGEFTRRAVLNGKMDLLQAEAVGDLVAARSRAMHAAVLGQLDGSLSRRISELRETVLQLEALIAYEIDFPEEDEGSLDSGKVDHAAEQLVAELGALLATGRSGELVRGGAAVVIAGPPNAGKSSLFNALIGQRRAIVTEIPGTTRDALEAMMDIGRWPVRLVDTAGLRETTELVERLGIEVSERWLQQAEAVLVCGDSSDVLSETMGTVATLTSALIIGVRTKADIRSWNGGSPESPSANNSQIENKYVSVSARTGEGMTKLIETIDRTLSERHSLPTPDAPVLMRERHQRAIARALEEVRAFTSARRSDVPSVIGAVHLRSAAGALEELIGAVDVEDVLGRVFSSFCVGK